MLAPLKAISPVENRCDQMFAGNIPGRWSNSFPTLSVLVCHENILKISGNKSKNWKNNPQHLSILSDSANVCLGWKTVHVYYFKSFFYS